MQGCAFTGSEMMETFDGKQLVLRPGLASNAFLSKVRSFKSRELFTDVEIHLVTDTSFGEFDQEDNQSDQETTIIKAHKLILSTMSPYFEAMFTTGFVEANQNVIEIKGEFFAEK